MARDLSYQDLKAKVSQGWDWDDFEAKYGIERNALKRHIRKNLCQNSNWAGRIIRNIEKNSKRKRRQQSKQAEMTPATDEVLSRDATTDVAHESVVELEISESAEVAPVTGAKSIGERLAELRQLESAESDAVVELELKHKELTNQHRNYIKALRTLRDEIDAMKQVLLAKGEQYEQIVAKIDSLTAEMRSVSLERRDRVAQLDDVQQQIVALETVVVCAYEDGTIAPFEEIEIALDDSGYTELLPQLVIADACQDLRGRDIHMVARLLRIYQNAEVKIEVISEIEGLEQAFTELTSNAA